MSKEEYLKFVADARLDTASGVEALRKKFAEFIAAQPRKYTEITNAPGCTGNYLADAKNCRECFHCYDAEDNAYGEHVWRGAKDCMDVSTAGRNANMIYNSINTGIDVANHLCVAQGWRSTFLEYSFNCFNSNHCIGSSGLRKKDYCILNKQYPKEEFEKIRDEIVRTMYEQGEWGEFFPAEVSPFGYNETVAQEQSPLTKESATTAGFAWEDHPRGTFGKETIQWDTVPDSINDIGDIDVVKEIFACTVCSKNYRIIASEFAFYKNLKIPLPRLCPDCRHARRIAARGPNKLWHRVCMCNKKHPHHTGQCSNEFETSYAPERKEIIYCEQCYNSEVA